MRGITSKHNGDCFHSFRTKNELESHKKLCENKDFCNVIMLSEDNRIEFNQHHKSNKAPFLIYADLESLTVKIDGFKNNPQKSSPTRVNEHISSGFSMSTISSLKGIEKKHEVYGGKDCTKKIK